MSSRNYSQTLGAGESIRLPGGRYFFVRAAAAPIDIETVGTPGSPHRFTAVGAGSKFGPLPEGQGWTQLIVTSATAQAIEVIISDDGLFEVANSVTVAGGVVVSELPATAVTDTADTTQASGTQTTISANLARRRITIGVLSTAAEGIRVSQAGGANTRGQEIQPGMSAEFRNTAALIVRNANVGGSGGNAVWWAEEEA